MVQPLLVLLKIESAILAQAEVSSRHLPLLRLFNLQLLSGLGKFLGQQTFIISNFRRLSICLNFFRFFTYRTRYFDDILNRIYPWGFLEVGDAVAKIPGLV